MIETERLLLKYYTLDEAPFVYKLMNSEGWLRNIGDRKIRTEEDARKYIEINYFGAYEKFGYGPFLVSLKESGVAIGSAGLYKREDLDYPDIGFVFLPEFWHMGYAYEAANAILQYGLSQLHLNVITGITLPDNFSSIKLLKKLGLSERGKYIYKDKNGETLLLFSNE